MKHKKNIVLVILLTLIFIYMLNIDSIPNKIILFQNEDFEISLLNGINIEGENIFQDFHFLNHDTRVGSEKTGTKNLLISSFGGLFQKDIEVSVLPTTKVLLGGDAVGIRLYSKGVLVIGESPVQSLEGYWKEPYKNTHIKRGDKILKVNGEKTETIFELITALSKVHEVASIEYEQDGSIIEESFPVVKCLDDGTNKLGLWVRDGAMGVGTLTFFEPSSGKITALGHGISDLDLKELIDVDEGYLNLAIVESITKGERGKPGEIRGLLAEDQLIGNIQKNNEYGIYGECMDQSFFDNRETVVVASKNEIEIGPAQVYCTVEEQGKPKAYDIKIVRINYKEEAGSKGMVIEVTDQALLRQTGGIIQGMSGSPIVQNGKLVGAITHVYVNDPTRGYAILAETMVNEMRTN